MSFRTKLFLLLLALSVAPILVLRVNGQRTLLEFSRDLADHSSQFLISKAQDHMLLLVEDHAMILTRNAQILEQTLRLQAVLTEKLLAEGRSEAIGQAQSEAAGDNAAELSISQSTALADGRMVSTPPPGHLPPFFDARRTPWYAKALEAQALTWTPPLVDPSTRRIGLTLSMPVRDSSGRIAGVTAIMTRMEIARQAREHSRDISERQETYLVSVAPHPDTKAEGLFILGQEENPDVETGPRSGMGRRMLGLPAPRWLTSDDSRQLEALMADLKAGTSGVRRMDYAGQDCLWAYAVTGTRRSCLVLVAPTRDVVEDAVRSARYIEDGMAAQLRNTWVVVAAALTAVILVAWFVSRSVTRPLRELGRAYQRVGRGDFTARVAPGGGRELAELGRVFNETVPQLKERTRLLQSMALAQEVQASLLPATLPCPPGLDLAGRSLYCDETGGDYFDAFLNAHGRTGSLAAMVGDVTGHGLDAALLMTTTRAFLRLRAHQPGTPAQVTGDVNRFLTLDTQGTGRFMTLFYLEIDTTGGDMRWVRAGHDPAMLYDPDRDDFEELDGPGIPLGVQEDRVFEECSRPALAPGQVLLVGSDGLWEARDASGEMFGKQRVREALRQNAARDARGVLEALFDALRAFMDARPVQDDVTILVIKAQHKENDA